MNRYVLRFTKKGNMKYISHLDLHRLFKRSLKKAGIDVDYSRGYNPHEMINVVQPLSLGFESQSEYFEMETPMDLDMEKTACDLNAFLPHGINFTAMRKIPHEKRNLSAYSEYASYSIIINGFEASLKQAVDFLGQDKIMILKRDKKTKQMVEKDVKAYVRTYDVDCEDGKTMVSCTLRCASNESLNPQQLAESFIKYCGADPSDHKTDVTRLDIYGLKNGQLVPLIDFYEDHF